MNNVLEFEKPVIELELKIREIENFAQEQGVDLSKEIETLRHRLKTIKKDVYNNITPWQTVKLARLQERPTTLDYIKNIVPDFIELHGDRLYQDDKAIVGGIGTIDGRAVTIIGHQKGNNTKENIYRNFGMPHPEGYRKALRLMKQAEKFNRPVITFIDTPGAYCGLEAEERGQGEAIAVNLLEMSRLKTPIINIVIGEGGSGGALALGIGDRVCMLENTIYSVISPEGLSSILWKDSTKAVEAAKIMKLRAKDLLDLCVIDNIIDEPLGGAQRDIEAVSNKLKKYIVNELITLSYKSKDELLDDRYDRLRSIGAYK